jgi:heme/copper-type cytochrome/quinol oxidase subunit 3
MEEVKLNDTQESKIHEELERTSLGVDSRKLGIWTFLASEALFFSSLIATYVILHVRSTDGPTPKQVLSIPLVSVNTFVLIASSLAMVTALSAAQNKEVRKAILWLVATAVLGLVFLGGQAFEFTKLMSDGLLISTNLFGASFFTLTGTHGLHVLSGIIWIVLLIIQLARGRETDRADFKIEMVGLYWHFVDLIWIIIFTIVYLIE